MTQDFPAGATAQPVTGAASLVQLPQKYDAVTRAIFAAMFACAIIQGGLGGLLPFMSAELDMSHTVESLHMTVMAVGGMVISLAAEPIRKRIGRLNSLALVLILAGTGAIGLVVAPNSAVSISAMFFLGLAMTGILLVGQNILVLIHRTRSARMIGEFSATFSIAALVCVLVLPVLAGSAFGWRAYPALQVVALVAFAAPLLVGAYRNKHLVPQPSIVPAAAEVPEPIETGKYLHGGLGVQFTRLTKRPIGLMAVVIALEWSLVFWTALFLIEVAGITPAQGAVATAVLLTGVLTGRLIGSVLLERLGGWRLLVLSCGLAVIAVFLLLQASSMPAALVTAAIAGLGAGNMYPASVALVLKENSQAKDRALAQASLFATLATVVWPLFLGQVADRVGLTNAILLLFLLLSATIFMLAWTRPKTA